jgi:RNA polymerase sigma factor (sigma-70 family)
MRVNPRDDRTQDTETGGARFATTHWSVVLAAGHSSAPGAQSALEQLCRTYWYPLYAFLRREGHSVEDAEDLVQGFFLHLLRRDILHTAEPGRGRFRSFLLGTLKHFLSDERGKAEAQKRGGGQHFISWDLTNAEPRYQQEPADESSPDRLFERRWALTLLEQALDRLQAECASDTRSEVFEHLQAFVTGEKGPMSYAEAAARLGLTLSGIKSTIFRLRRRYHELVREEVGRTVAEPAEIEDELRYLIEVFSRPGKSAQDTQLPAAISPVESDHA